MLFSSLARGSAARIAASVILAATLLTTSIAVAKEDNNRRHLSITIETKDRRQMPAKLWTLPSRAALETANRPPSSKDDGKKPRSIILAFHQAGASSEEYVAIAPRLVGLGYEVLAIDQRVGGKLFGGTNAYAAAYTKEWRRQQKVKRSKKKPKTPPYMDAWPDLEAALAWAKAAGYKDIVLWGSSYSSSLAIKLGAVHPEVRAVLAFSPGEYLSRGKGGGTHVVTMAAGVYAKFEGSPRVLVVTPPKERKRVETIMAALGNRGSLFVPAGGVHGSSTLVVERCAVAPTVWPMVERFLRESKVRVKR